MAGEKGVVRGVENAGENDFDDLFHDVIMSEERSQGEGYREGRESGERKGLVEGCKLGFEKGAAIGSEIGFYQGFVEAHQQLVKQGTEVKPRAQKTIESLSAMLDQFPVSDTLNDSLFEDLEKIRAKFKQVTSLLAVNLSYGSEGQTKGVTF